MKTFLKAVAALAAGLLLIFFTVRAIITARIVYPDAMTVKSISGDLVTVETCTGNMFQFYGAEDYAEGDIVAVLMYSAGTENVTDDAILCAKYAG